MSPLLLIPLFLPLILAETSTPNTGDQPQSFLFGFTNPSSNLVLPITPTCPSPLTLSPLTPTNEKTSDPKAPYTMITLVHEQLMDGSGIQYERVYSASVDVGDMSKVREVRHPWGNGTQFIACIWGSNGASGGCQDLFTVVPSEDTFNAYATANSTCRAPNVLESWVPPANETLDVEVMGKSGDVSWNAWPASCSDLQINPKNGTPPYTLLVAPAAHPPVNITTSTLPINYTVRLTHGQAFMLGLYDSSGNSWAFGPLHAGASDDLACLAVTTGQQTPEEEEMIGVAVLAGSVAGAFVVGAIGAAGLMWFFMGGKKRVRKSSSEQNLYSDPRPASYSTPTNSFIGKQLSPNGNSLTPYMDSPEFDTPATLYDPHVPGPNPQNYPQPPGSASHDNRVFPRPPLVHTSEESYRENISLGEMRNERDRRSSVTSGQGGHIQDPSWASSTNSRQSRRQTTPKGSPGIVIQNPSSPRPGSFGSKSHHQQNDEPSSPSSGRGPRHVYVVHSDGGNGDLHIQLPDSNSRVIELPPGYRPAPDDANNTNDNTGGTPSPQPTATRQLPTIPGGEGLEPVRSRNSGTEEELRARAEARMREKMRGPS
ncbi:hypothetical protein I302_100392 [Kwoniella bestiolae CBS 10118]|uniref:Uncharacterized protein n=1 Tax=Kwoniella bestiolae CBS 10118 TaxID=1296100 RepID=A0A1B9G4X6_9TREE|nr:hypothetical protein I302_03766 [Kwoniella bestiolae CBS 10118]OCF26089.1 hypothetical protein I302_03766 [Kwoniella bestiolae CBS 10118]